MASKAFQATLRNLDDTQLAQLQSGATANCATSVVCRRDVCTVLLATRERAKTGYIFLRSVRNTLTRWNNDTSEVKRRGLSLTTEDAVNGEVAVRNHGAQSPIAAPLGDVTITEWWDVSFQMGPCNCRLVGHHCRVHCLRQPGVANPDVGDQRSRVQLFHIMILRFLLTT